MVRNGKGSPRPPASLQLLVPPVRLMSAFVWKAVQQDSAMQYEKLLDFIDLVTEVVPELLSPSQKCQLVLGLRARFVLELCRGNGVTNLKSIQGHLDKIHTCCLELSTSEHMESSDILKTSYSNFANLVQNILNVPLEKEVFFQDVFPEHYGSAFNQRVQQLVSLLLTRLEQLLPIPDLQQTANWLNESSASEDLGHHLSEPFSLKTLLLHHRELGTLSSASSSTEEDVILSTLALSTQTDQFSEEDEDDDDKFESDEDPLALEDLEEDSNQSLDDTSEDWVPKNKSGSLSRLFICTKGPGTQHIQRTARKNIQREQRWTAPVQSTKAVKKGNKNQLKSQEMKSKNKKPEDNLKNQQRAKQKDSVDKKGEHDQKKDGLKNKSRRKRKEPTGEDKRFLSTRPVKKIFTEEETKCLTCEKTFEHPNQLKTHVKLHSFRYSCIQCEKGFTSQSGYYHHQRLHKRGREFKCKECNKGFLCSYSLKQHERLHDGPTNFCAICGRNFSKNGFIRHMQMHRGERNFLCTTCGKAFLSSGELRLHNRSHTGEMPYTCVHCGKGFSSKGHLVVHTRSHTGERPYLCAECPKRFLTLNCLKRHSLSHNGVKPFKCPNCDREFSQQGNMKRHMATHKPDC
ncbi:zinc finger and SCAN domain-containing protein 2-like [Girardinichthys multiradiatus]|uniref:zinc finger and SCAN domain-containing protein 2-like n=1 Tax=Girardinichthys multiradiatus TaxID=208333 RepID=UPI001FAE3E03|nr:zinc finger and SCAN domain-containing protein 2-like [Girardinichthys multiradiatus]